MEWLKNICDFWLKQVQYCRKAKDRDFGKTATQMWQFYEGEDRIVDVELQGVGDEWADDLPVERMHIRINKMRQFVDVMLPYVFTDVPHRLAAPRLIELPPELQQFAPNSGPTAVDRLRAYLMESVLNYLPGEYGYTRELRTMLPEMLVKGRGVMWVEMVDGPYGRIPASHFVSVDDVLIDADCEQVRDAGFVIRERHVSTRSFSEETGVPVEKLRGTAKSHIQQAVEPVYQPDHAAEDEKDIVTVYEVWSRIGLGQHLRDAAGVTAVNQMADSLDDIGRHCFLQIVPGLDYPANIDPEAMKLPDWQVHLKTVSEWPMALFENPNNPFPCVFFDVYPNAKNPWATSPQKSSFPLQLFMDRVYTFAMRALRTTARRLVITAKELEDKVKQAIVSGLHDEVVYYEGEPIELTKLVHILELPPLNEDVWTTLAAAERKYEQISGMDPLLAGGQPEKQIRSAHESHMRQTHVTNKPNDFADAVLAAESELASKEAQALRLYVGPDVVAPLFNEPVPTPTMPELQAMFDVALWAQVAPEEYQQWAVGSPLSTQWSVLVSTDDPAVAAAEMTYTLEAGSAARRNKQQAQENAQMLTQLLLQSFLQMAMQGMQVGSPEMVAPYNNLMSLLGETYDFPASKMQLAPPVMAPQIEGPPQGESVEVM